MALKLTEEELKIVAAFLMLGTDHPAEELSTAVRKFLGGNHYNQFNQSSAIAFEASSETLTSSDDF
jgi:hypothetical protein